MGTAAVDLKADLNKALARDGIEMLGSVGENASAVLTPDSLRFVARLVREFGARRLERLDARRRRQAEFDRGVLPDFLLDTEEVRAGDWTVAPIPPDLKDRRVEITGPVDRKMVINALNSGAKTFMADFEDSHSPTWDATVQGQVNLHDAVRRTIEFVNESGKRYALNTQTAVLLVRPRGWHLEERHLLVDGKPVPASLFDFGLYFFNNAKELLARGSGPYFYLPKLESHLEARLWNDVFLLAQETLGIPRGSIRATVLIETIPAAFEMDEILFELKEHSSGLNCGRWDYIFSVIKKFGNLPEFVLPDRSLVGMTAHFMRSYSKLLIRSCHRRGAHAMGGMAAQIPIKNDARANEAALAKVRADKEREAGDGHDGTWVAHPGLVALATEIFDAKMPGPHQIGDRHDEYSVSAGDLLSVPAGARTEAGLRWNLTVGLQYLAAWLSGIGCVPLYDLMEDAATAEISRSQVWQWVRHGAALDDGRPVTLAMARGILAEQIEAIRRDPATRFDPDQLDVAAELFDAMIASPTCVEFLTVPAYERLS
ncbi:MAG: malate synthase A [Elusimicrobia bacterium CG1_02_63_36]|nr:MAG: malate synthase A [Elusimicrobia bacterium CG1_02_63_36]PIP84255.1 MAG: malate synthase A [Elusimicrobia bacterium CG22_combo_CG10-13_8_21_14_all_63_91]PJA17149.1 MAG: malate synthase A [Elusimicrobia bacterium CG_4_10_14_0_2_um_filter_63_34]PJB25645.1 MAG: malate synthase A [Elusimicrobia bacterium CG_4_9_14_3_um_filter_62_55]